MCIIVIVCIVQLYNDTACMYTCKFSRNPWKGSQLKHSLGSKYQPSSKILIYDTLKVCNYQGLIDS